MNHILYIVYTYLFVFQSHVVGDNVVDLTHDFVNGTVYWPSRWGSTFRIMDDGSVGDFKRYWMSTPVHGGTHMDAPRFFQRSKNPVNQLPLERLVGKAFIVDVSEEVKNKTDLFITVDHLLASEKRHGKSMNGKIVLLYTGFCHYWPDRNKYLGTNTSDMSLLHFPGLHPETSKWIVEKRTIKSIGIDTSSIDHGQSKTYISHQFLFSHNVPVFKNLNLREIDKLRKRDDVMIYALPMKIKDGSGAPLRIIATYKGLSAENKADLLLTAIALCMAVFHLLQLS